MSEIDEVRKNENKMTKRLVKLRDPEKVVGHSLDRLVVRLIDWEEIANGISGTRDRQTAKRRPDARWHNYEQVERVSFGNGVSLDVVDQTGGIRSLLNMSKGGNEAATNAALTRFAEHEIVEGGVKRMNQLEYENLATKLGSWGRKFTAWLIAASKGRCQQRRMRKFRPFWMPKMQLRTPRMSATPATSWTAMDRRRRKKLAAVDRRLLLHHRLARR